MADKHGAFAQFSRQLLPRRFIDIAECDLGAFTRSSFTTSRPTPLAPPVTSATLPCKRFVIYVSSVFPSPEQGIATAT
jgi:hypothetical protein